MAIHEDVLVIGGGIAGTTAALAAAETGAQVRLVTHKKSTLRQASGLIDVLGYAPDVDGPVSDPFAAIESLPEGHPYQLLGETAIRGGLTVFDEAVGEAYEGSHTDTNALLTTSGGAIKPTSRYPTSTAAGLVSDDRAMLIVGFRSLTDFDGELVADHLAAAGVPFSVDGVEIEVPGSYRADSRVTRIANALDLNKDLDYEGRSLPAREAFAEVIKPHLGDADRVGLPAVLGDDHADAVRADLERHLGAAVFELPMGPPSYPGLRLEDILFDALDEAGVRLSDGNPAVGYEADGDAIDAVIVDQMNKEVPYSAEQVVLATGGLVGKGIDSDREGVREPVFDCHVPHPDDRYDWFVDDAFGEHPFAKFGVQIDEACKPLDADGVPEFSNLRAAGGVVGGVDRTAEKSKSGVSLATGYAAGTAAGEAI